MENHFDERKKYDKEGISLVELLLTVAIIGILSGATIPLGIKFNQKSQFRNTRDSLVSYLNTAKSFAISGRYNNNWGVYVTDTQIILFNGSDFSSRDTTLDQDYNIPASVSITSAEIIFSKETGDATEEVVDIYGAEESTTRISISAEGNITYN